MLHVYCPAPHTGIIKEKHVCILRMISTLLKKTQAAYLQIFLTFF